MSDRHPEQNVKAATGNGRTKPPGLKEIAAHLHLSPATVSMVINDVPLAKSLSKETRERVLAAAREFNYRPNLIARALSKRETRTVGVIAPESSDGYFTRVMRGVETAMLEAGYLYFTTSHLWRPDLVREYPNALVQRGVDGLIFVNTPVYEHPGVPTVCISNDCTLDDVASVLVDQQEGMQVAVRHLAELGHERIVVMRGSEFSLDADDRYQAILRAARELGLVLDPELVLALNTHQLTPEVGYRATAGLLRRTTDFTAILAFNDWSALGALRALEDHGLHCPADVSIIGIDDVCTAPFLSPRLTTCAQPLEDMGAAAAEQLVARIQNRGQDLPARTVFPMTLRVRESTRALAESERALQPARGGELRAWQPSAQAPSMS
jgi:DNA-binding LacI/PurR family transcriptional regulator